MTNHSKNIFVVKALGICLPPRRVTASMTCDPRALGGGGGVAGRWPVFFTSSDEAASAVPALAPATGSQVIALPPWGPTLSCSKWGFHTLWSSVLDPRVEDGMKNDLTPGALSPLGEPGKQRIKDTDSVASARAGMGPSSHQGASTSLCQEHPRETARGRGQN